jgi:hypothetical protein
MSLEDKVKFGMIALGGAALVFHTLGVHLAPLDSFQSYGD